MTPIRILFSNTLAPGAPDHPSMLDVTAIVNSAAQAAGRSAPDETSEIGVHYYVEQVGQTGKHYDWRRAANPAPAPHAGFSIMYGFDPALNAVRRMFAFCNEETRPITLTGWIVIW